MKAPNLSYPIGKFKQPTLITEEQLSMWVDQIAQFPAKLAKEVAHLDDAQLSTLYRPGGWTIRQVVHHVADSHMNAYIRFKLALTEETPTIRPYDEKAWALIPEAQHGDIGVSLQLLTALHQRWVDTLKEMSAEQLERSYYHPADEELVPIKVATGIYAWHGNHHLAHVVQAKRG
ncbi:MAG: YfiT family bacillithiol transferase [Bacteroidota bacterium]